MTNNFPGLNFNKTKVIFLSHNHLRITLSNDVTTLDSISLASDNIVRNLGVIFDQHLYFDAHKKQVSRAASFHLHNIAKI